MTRFHQVSRTGACVPHASVQRLRQSSDSSDPSDVEGEALSTLCAIRAQGFICSVRVQVYT